MASWRSMTKIAGSGSNSQRHGSADPDPHQNVMDPEHCWGPLTWGWPKAALRYAVSFSSLYQNTDGWMVRRKLPRVPLDWLAINRYTHYRDREKISVAELIDPDLIPQSGIYDFGYRSGHPVSVQYLNNTEPQLNLRWTWACCAVILWHSSLCMYSGRGKFMPQHLYKLF